MPPPGMLASLLRARRGYLGIIGSDGGPRVLPVCFTWAGDVIWTAADAKPKGTEESQGLRDIGTNAKASFTVDRWDENWSRLAWLQALGTARILGRDDETERVLGALADKYSQYASTPLTGPVIRIDVASWAGWSAAADGGRRRL
ncbi:MAG: TIGR03668 family PPOX class F420-dependent oxidoreductase [Actinomycetota bacterium]